MKLLRVRLTLRSAFATPWLADTLAGHLCWAALRRYGDDLLRVLLDDALEGRPMFVLSDGFPGDLLPAPVLPPPSFESALTIADQRQRFRHERARRTRRYLSAEAFGRVLRGEAVSVDEDREQEPVRMHAALKNQLDRASGTTAPGGELYEFQEYWGQEPLITCYALVREEDEDLFRDLVAELAATGYGKRKTVGYGAITSASIEEASPFPFPEGANGFVCLSTFVPAAADPVRGQWEVLVKYGKLGEELAHSADPFKRPLIMLRAGATFAAPQMPEFVGRAVSGLAPSEPDTLQLAFGLPVPMVLPA